MYGEANPWLIVFTALAMCLRSLSCWKNEAAGNQMLPRWYYMVDQYLMVLFCVHSSTNFHKIAEMQSQTIRAASCFTPSCLTDGCRQSLLYLLLFSTNIDEFNQKFHIWIHWSIKVYGNGFSKLLSGLLCVETSLIHLFVRWRILLEWVSALTS